MYKYLFSGFLQENFFYVLFPRLLTDPDSNSSVSVYIILFSQVATLL